MLVTKADSFCRELSTWDVGDSRSLTPWPLSQRANGAPRVPAPFRFSDCSYSAVGSCLLPTSVAYFEFHSGPNLFYVVAGFDHNQHEGDASENSCCRPVFSNGDNGYCYRAVASKQNERQELREF